MRIGIERRVSGRVARRAGRARPRLYFPLSLSFVIFPLFLFSFVRRERVVGEREAPV